ncbi:MAG TPA: glycosyl hydrolase family 9, cellulase [Ruminococcus sp.]|nr:glycosyl hydrolase family 9, cellulase [Ruminococcus sp.]HCR73017.1 glycosyl hydrolase family 9, cellulase [Ruminococcus sp.]
MNNIKKIISLTAAVALLGVNAVCSPVSEISAQNVNIVSNSTFDSGTSGWGTYKESGGKASLTTENGQLALKVQSVGTLNYSVQVYYDIVPLYQNGVYRLKYDISSSIDRDIECMIQQNGGTYQAYTWKGLSLTSEPQTVDYTFTMEEETDIMSKLVFNCGTQGTDLPEHTIYIDNVVIELVDDSNVDYSATAVYEPPIVTNQVGYKPSDVKTAVFRNIDGATEFSVVNADTQQIVYTGQIYGETQNSSAGETDYLGDFSEVKENGNYYITCGNADNSYTFSISDNVYSNLLDDSVRMLYLQRCGTDINDDTFGHKACHTGEAVVYGTNQKIDVSGGWHDAGDYGRYIVPAAKSVADLLYAYQTNPELYSDNINIPESGNGIPDILDEVRYELEWMLKMQSESGGVYHKVSCISFPGYIMPENETGQLVVTPVTTTATADFCASMALAYEFYNDIDSDFAEKCLDAAEKAWAFLESNPNLIFKNPEDITTGEYGDKSDSDERYWAAAQMYRATGEQKYLQAFENKVSSGLDWATVGDYGNIAFLTMKNADKSSDLYNKIKSSFLSRADSFAAASENSPYGVSITKFDWGSNMTVANAGVILGTAHQISDDSDNRYLNAAKANLNYLLGKNPNGECYVTGYGTVSPQNPHHRPSMAKGTAMKGMLVGGVNSNLEDSAAKAYLMSASPAKCYVDHSESYSTNEITIYWNSPLTYLMSLTEAESAGGDEEPVKGDVNNDGTADVLDLVILKNYILGNISEISQNADISGDGNIDVNDVSLLKKIIISSK